MPHLYRVPEEFADSDTLFETFVEYTKDTGITLYPAQEEAILAILTGDNTVMATPTGSGKSMVALAAAFFALCRGQRTYYTAPIKALVSEKFFDLTHIFGADNVGMVTGDSTVNADAPIICATAEILANQALREGATLDVGMIVMDEFHYYGDPQRGWAWQVPLLTLPAAQFVLMSATLGDTSAIQKSLTELTGRDCSLITSAHRPVPLSYAYSEEPLHETLSKLVRDNKAPIYVVSFAQAAAVELASSVVNANLATREQREEIAEEIRGFGFSKGFGVALKRMLLAGVGVHHAGMLPKYRRLVEHLASSGKLSVISGTDTLGVGINVPIRTVVLTGLTKFDGFRQRRLRVREFQQIVGRAGRAGFDTEGFVVAQAPEHVIENKKALLKAGDDPKKRRKVVKKQAPEGFVNWSETTFNHLVEGKPEELKSRMRITHSTVINLLSRPHASVDTVKDFIDSSHDENNLDMYLRALRIGRNLLDAGVIDRRVVGERVEYAPVKDLGPQFALNQPLSPFALAALELFDPESDTYAMDVLSVIEATTEVSYAVLKGQLNRIKREELAALKADGVDYAERMEILDEITYPQPNGEVLEDAFDAFTHSAPWLREIGITPKAVVADMVEHSMNFSQFVNYYGLARVEGGLLRYLTDVYRSLVQNVPHDLRNEELTAIIEWLGATVMRVDSSLVEEWEALKNAGDEAEVLPALDMSRTFSEDTQAFTRAVRNAMFHRVILAERAAYDALGDLDGESGWTQKKWEDAIEDFYDEYGDLGVSNDSRGPKFFNILDKEDEAWTVRQILDDPEGDMDWAITARVDLPASDEAGEVVVEILDVGPLTGN